MPCSICSPPEASAPDLMVRNPTLIGAACATAAGTFSADVATLLASAPFRTVRRLSFMLFPPVGFLSSDAVSTLAGTQRRRSGLGVFPPPLRGRVMEGGRRTGYASPKPNDPRPQPLPARGRGADRACGTSYGSRFLFSGQLSRL